MALSDAAKRRFEVAMARSAEATEMVNAIESAEAALSKTVPVFPVTATYEVTGVVDQVPLPASGLLRLSNGGGGVVAGIQAGVDGQILIVQNVDGAKILLDSGQGTPAATDVFVKIGISLTTDGIDITSTWQDIAYIAEGEAIMLIYLASFGTWCGVCPTAKGTITF